MGRQRHRQQRHAHAGDGGPQIAQPFRVAPGAGSGESYSHDGEEFLYLVRGRLNIELAGEKFELRAGDSFYFSSKTQHRWVNPGKAETLILWINTPPTF